MPQDFLPIFYVKNKSRHREFVNNVLEFIFIPKTGSKKMLILLQRINRRASLSSIVVSSFTRFGLSEISLTLKFSDSSQYHRLLKDNKSIIGCV